ncbi:MAG TPA: nucleotidyltransferase family protein [Vicinamibacterales bacterium]|nr:nucleotidyltransferase family protein [Vicinamibacterales bacterium]
MVPGLVLAAGRSSRMGRPKALLRLTPSGPTFVARIVHALRAGGTADALVVGRPDDVELQAELERVQPPARFVPNPHAESGQLSSLLAGLNVVDHPGVHGVLITLVDLPLVKPTSVEALLSAFSRTGAPIVRAVHRGGHGHPVIFGREVFPDLRAADPQVGAKAVFRRHAEGVVDVEVDDPGVLVDVDVPADLERLESSGPE